jgi:Rrf2 family protein
MISQTAEYALRAVVCLARDPQRRLTGEDIARRTEVPSPYLSKVLQSLVKAGLLTSRRGRLGGFGLAAELDQIDILQVINAVDPIQRITHCPLGLPEHEQLCALHRRVDQAIAATEDAFRSTTLQDLLEDPGPHWPLGPPDAS